MEEEKSEESEGSKIVEEARKRFRRAESFYSPTRQLAIADTQFAMGDSDNGWQWPTIYRDQRVQQQRVVLTVNLTAQHCNQIINQIRQNKPTAKVSPVDNYADKKTAEILAGLLRNVQVSSNADDAHDLGAEHSIYGGEGFWRIYTEYESPESFNQSIKIGQCPNPNLIFVDPDCKELDKSDAQWGFVFEDIPIDQAKREYPDIDPVSSWTPGPANLGWVQKDTVRRAEYFYCEIVKDKALLLSDGIGELESNLPEGSVYTPPKDKLPGSISMPSGERIPVFKERETDRKVWYWCKLVGGCDEPLDKQIWPGDFLPIVSVVGKELNVNGQIIRKGIVRDLKDPARMVNFSYSETVQTLALQNKVPYMAAAEAIEGYEELWKSANLENRNYLPWNALRDDGTPIPKPERQPPAAMPAAQIHLLQLSTEQMRGASGQQNSNFGIKSEAQSGIGIERLKVQGEVATFHFPDNLRRALQYEAKVVINLIQKIYDTRRVVRILGIDGKEEHAILDPEAPKPYAENQIGEQDIEKIFNPLLGKYDVVISTGPTFQTQRQEAFAAMTELAQADPTLMAKAGDLIIRASDFPMAEQLADRLAKTIPPELQDDKPGQAPKDPQAQMMIQNMDQAIQGMTQHIGQLEESLAKAEQQLANKDGEIAVKNDENTVKSKEADAKAVEAEAKRMEAEAKLREADADMIRAEAEARQPVEQEDDANELAAVTALQDQLSQISTQIAALKESPAPQQQPIIINTTPPAAPKTAKTIRIQTAKGTYEGTRSPTGDVSITTPNGSIVKGTVSEATLKD
jgi:hypothetical protein